MMTKRRLATILVALSLVIGSNVLAVEMSAEMEKAIGDLMDMITSHTSIIETNMDDPEKAMTEIQAYCAANGDKIKQAYKTIQEEEAKMSPEDKEAFEKQMEETYKGEIEAYEKAMQGFTEKHPDIAMKFLEAMGACMPE
ncbi:MAG: hypothetical protein KKC50_08260 [Candidatus Omnitrophica bacterium]|nr:hypothetical protein [Candidatus Omnitrophota bacterium]